MAMCGALRRFGLHVFRDDLFRCTSAATYARPAPSALDFGCGWAARVNGRAFTGGTVPSSDPASVLQTAKVPTIETAKAMPKDVSEFHDETLIILAEQGCHQACTERLRRLVMTTDDVDWESAAIIVNGIRDENRKVVWVASVPHRLGLFVALSTGIGSIPLVFHRDLVMWFNRRFVKGDVPEAADIETFLEIGAWSWNWMEPILGTASFSLLALQFARAQMLNMNIRPYTDAVREWRARRLVRLYPQYNEDIISDFARTSSLTPLMFRT